MYSNKLKSTVIYAEMDEANRDRFFYKTADKFIAGIDTLYCTVYVKGDSNENSRVLAMIGDLEKARNELEKSLDKKLLKPVIDVTEKKDFSEDLYFCKKGVKGYGLGITAPDLYDIFFTNRISTPMPRIQIQIRSFALHMHGYHKCIGMVSSALDEFLGNYKLELDKVNITRIDYCVFTNSLRNIENLFKKDKKRVYKSGLKTTLKGFFGHDSLSKCEPIIDEYGNIRPQMVGILDFVGIGSKNGDVFARIYDKGKEILEQSNKLWFFNEWKEKGLISEYDRFCYRWVSERNIKSVDMTRHLSRAALAFYIEYGKCEKTKMHYRNILDDVNNSLRRSEEVARKEMPEVTIVNNFEFTTKRGFYTNAFETTNSWELKDRALPIDTRFNEVYKILDNENIIRDLLTSEVLCFVDHIKEDGTVVYKRFWKLLRRAKFSDDTKAEVTSGGVFKRNNQAELDIKAKVSKVINSIASLYVAICNEEEREELEKMHKDENSVEVYNPDNMEEYKYVRNHRADENFTFFGKALNKFLSLFNSNDKKYALAVGLMPKATDIESTESVGVDDGIKSTESVGVDDGIKSTKSVGVDEGIKSTGIECIEDIKSTELESVEQWYFPDFLELPGSKLAEFFHAFILYAKKQVILNKARLKTKDYKVDLLGKKSAFKTKMLAS